jgi:hypothetical protein
VKYFSYIKGPDIRDYSGSSYIRDEDHNSKAFITIFIMKL